MQSVSTFMYTSVFRRRSRKNKKYWSIKGYGLFMFSPCSHSSTEQAFHCRYIYFIRYTLWIDMSEVLYKKKLFEDKWVNNINKVYEISRYFKIFFFLFFFCLIKAKPWRDFSFLRYIIILKVNTDG